MKKNLCVDFKICAPNALFKFYCPWTFSVALLYLCTLSSFPNEVHFDKKYRFEGKGQLTATPPSWLEETWQNKTWEGFQALLLEWTGMLDKSPWNRDMIMTPARIPTGNESKSFCAVLMSSVSPFDICTLKRDSFFLKNEISVSWEAPCTVRSYWRNLKDQSQTPVNNIHKALIKCF